MLDSGGPSAGSTPAATVPPPSTERSRIGIVCFPYAPTLSPDRPRGIDRYLQELIGGLRAKGFTVDHVGTAQPFRGTPQLLAEASRCLLEVGRLRAQVYHAADPLGAAFLLLGAKRPVVVTIHDTIPFGAPAVLGPSAKPLRFLVWRTLVRLCLRMADAVIVPFPSTAADLATIRPEATRRIHSIGYGITIPPGWSPVVGPRSSAEDRTILFMGGTQPVVRGGLLCLRVVARLRDEGVHVRLAFVGSGPEMPAARATCRELRLDDRVAFRPLVPDEELIPFLAKFDALVYPSPLGFSYILLQAMIAGTPVVTTRARDLPDFVDGFGVLCPAEDVDSFAAAVRRLVEDPTYRDELAEQGRSRSSGFRADAMVDQVVGVYREVGVEGSPPADLIPADQR